MAKNRTTLPNLTLLPLAVFKGLIRAYQYLLSPWLGHHCRFTPRCSDYALEAFDHYGVCKGLYLTTKRLLKCHPWHSGGLDPLPKADNSINNKESLCCCVQQSAKPCNSTTHRH